MVWPKPLLTLFLSFPAIYAHGGADHDSSAQQGGANWHYAQRHMASEHHIDTFDPQSFFLLHDLDRDGFWNREEIEAVYGVHHVYSQKKSKDDVEHQQKADQIVGVVLNIMDKNKDGKIALEEFQASGLNALPSFEGLGAEGHHYDVESEFFLHHEELYHSTPETQTDESYNHPEDHEHFAHHDDIEKDEVVKEAKYQGISVEEAVAEHEKAEAEASLQASLREAENQAAGGDGEGSGQVKPPGHAMPTIPDQQANDLDNKEQEGPGQKSSSTPRYQRQPPPDKLDPSVRYQDARKDSSSQAEWGTGEGGYKAPKTPAEKLRKNLPYKYKFRKNWGDF